MVELATTIWADGPSSTPFEPPKPQIRAWGTWLEGIITAFTSNGGLIYSSKAFLDADLSRGSNAMAWVMGDPIAANNGIYVKAGLAGAGSWSRRGDLPFSFIVASNVGAGTANALQATTSIPVSGSALTWVNVTAVNTGSPVTISFNSGAVLTVKTNSGNDVVAGGLQPGMIVTGIVSGSTFRLLSDQASAAIVAAAETASVAAQGAAAAAQGFANNNLVFDTLAVAQAATIPGAVTGIVLRGMTNINGDDGGLFTLTVNPVAQSITVDGRTWYRSGDVGSSRLSQALAIGSQNNKPRPFDKSFIQNNVGVAGTFAVKIKMPSLTGVIGFQGITWVARQGRFYSTLNRSNSDGSERINILRSDASGEVLDYSATLGPGSTNTGFDLSHGQDLDWFYIGDQIYLVSDSASSRGASVIIPNATIGNGWVPTGYRSFILQPPEVTAGTVALSTDKRYLVKTGGPYLGAKNIRIYDLNQLLAGPDGDRQSECIWEMIQPEMGGLPNQGLWMHDGVIYMLNGTQDIAQQTRITAIDIASKTVIDEPLIITAGKDLAAAQKGGAGAKCEPEGCFVVQPQAGGPLQFWMGVGMDNVDGTAISSFAMPIFQRDFGATPANGNRSPFAAGVNFAGGPHKASHPRAEDFTDSYYETTVDGTKYSQYMRRRVTSDTVISFYMVDISGVEHRVYDIDRVTGAVTWAAAPLQVGGVASALGTAAAFLDSAARWVMSLATAGANHFLFRSNTAIAGSISSTADTTTYKTSSAGDGLTSNAGTPESVVAAPPGTICIDRTNGVIYVKKSGTGNAGWKLVTQAT